jgi:hypothetical protein
MAETTPTEATPNPNDEALANPTPDFDPLASNLVQDVYIRLLSKNVRYGKLDRYIKGKHDLAFATTKWKGEFGKLFGQFRDNYCRRVVETLSDYVQFEAVKTGNDAADGALSDWFEAQKIDAEQGRISHDAFLYGDAYAILAPDPDDEAALRFYRQIPGLCEVYYDPERTDSILFALKIWRTLGNAWRLNVYTQEGVFRYTSRKNTRARGDTTQTTSTAPATLRGYSPLADTPFEPNIVEGKVPFFHWSNIPTDDGEGVSELDDVIPLQDELNKVLCDMMVTSEFQSYRQRWATGIEVEYGPDGKEKPQNLDGPHRLMWSTSSETKFGEFEQADLNQHLAAAKDARQEIARISRIPLHHLSMTDNFPSGESLKTAEAPLQAKIKDRVKSWGNVWEAVAAYNLEATDAALAAGVKKYSAEFADTTPRSRKEEADAEDIEVGTAEKKIKLGVSRKKALEELGYSEEEQEQFKEDNLTDAEERADLARKALGNETGFGVETVPGAPVAPNRLRPSGAPAAPAPAQVAA